MSDPKTPQSALGGATFDGFARVEEIGPLGMISLRHKGGAALEKAVKAVTGTRLPGVRRIETAKGKSCGWMSPDEYLLILAYEDVPKALEKLAKALAGEHHLAADVSDARAVFRITGPLADQVLRKLMPVDFDRLEPGELRRSRAAQVAAAVWAEGNGFKLVSFRSVAGYVVGLLSHSAIEGSTLGDAR